MDSLIKRLRIRMHRNLIRFGIDVRKTREDRKLLEQVLLPEIARTPEYQHILFVGCAWYTLHYPEMFQGRDFSTMEMNPDEAKYGAANHIVDNCKNIANHFRPNTLDAVVLNGVYGFGLNELDAIQETLAAIHQSLREQGLFVFGWNDTPETAPYRIEELTGLNAFAPYPFPPLHRSIHESDTKNRHRFHFYRKEIS